MPPRFQPALNLSFFEPPAAGNLGAGKLTTLGHAVDGEAVEAKIRRHFLDRQEFVSHRDGAQVGETWVSYVCVRLLSIMMIGLALLGIG